MNVCCSLSRKTLSICSITYMTKISTKLKKEYDIETIIGSIKK